jgi:hypothetical protein
VHRLLMGCMALSLLTACGLDIPLEDRDDTLLEKLWVVHTDALSPAEQTLAVTLQGLVARERTAIWVADGCINGVILQQLQAEGVSVQETRSVWELLDVFRAHVNGAIVYDSGTPSINVATSLCGPKRAVAVEASLVARAQAEGLDLLLDVRGYDELRAFQEFGELFAHGYLVVQHPDKVAHLRDFAVLSRAFVFWDVDAAAYALFASKLGSSPLVFGWGGDEHRWVQEISTIGGAGVPADWSRNLSVLSRLPVELASRPRRVPAPAQKGERIVAFVMSDGDNIQWVGGCFVSRKGFWASPHRGAFSMTWEMAPILAEAAPRVMNHFYSTASSGDAIDDFVTGPSGVGYSFHNYLPDRQRFAESTARYMGLSDLSVATMLNSGGGMHQSVELLDQPQVMGVLYKDYAPYNARQGEIFWHNGKPCISYRYLLWEPNPQNSPQGVAAAIAQQPASPTTDPDSYALINVHAWSYADIGGPMEAVRQTVDLLPPGTRVVTAEELITLLRQNFGTPPGA